MTKAFDTPIEGLEVSGSANAAMCVGTFQTTDDRIIRLNINKEGLAGEYKVKLIVDMNEYVFDKGLKM